MSRRRVVVTGMGVITPLGETIDSFWDQLLLGASGVREVSLFDTSGFDVTIGGECTSFNADAYIDRKINKRLDRFAQFAMAASQQAMNASELGPSCLDLDRAGVIIGSGIGGLMELETQKQRLLEKGPGKVSAFTIPKLMVNAGSGNVSIEHGFRGPSNSVATACASAADAMGVALTFIRSGVADVIITGGSEAALTPLGLTAFAAMKALSSREAQPTEASCPFDSRRDGFVLGEGAGVLIFEELEHARKRGARILAEVVGYGASADANHITQPLEDGRGGAAAMRNAIADAQIAPNDIAYVNAHGTSTPLGDVAETVAIKQVFGDHAANLAVSSTKSSIGHSLGASGGIELIVTIQAMQNGVAPPTINLQNPGENCDLDYVPNKPRDLNINCALSNSFGFGGHNASLVVRRFE